MLGLNGTMQRLVGDPTVEFPQLNTLLVLPDRENISWVYGDQREVYHKPRTGHVMVEHVMTHKAPGIIRL